MESIPLLQQPAFVGRYRIQETVGRGGMGVVYKAFDPIIERTVAIKIFRATMTLEGEALESYLETFYREARAAGRLNHPAIVLIHDVGEWRRFPYIVMEFLDGTSLQVYLKKGWVFSWEEAARIIHDVADALYYAHQRGVIHRDIKPSNIMILDDGRVKVLDFGVAKIVGTDTTSKGELIGTPSYLAPEVLHGGEARPESDLFSLGVVFYQLVTGQKPFKGDSIAAVLSSLLNDTPIPPSKLNPDIPPFLDTIIFRLLAKKPEDRYRMAGALVSDLKRLISHGHTIRIKLEPDEDLDYPSLEPLTEEEYLDEPTLKEKLPSWMNMYIRYWLRLPRWTRWSLIALLVALFSGMFFLMPSGSTNSVPPTVQPPQNPPQMQRIKPHPSSPTRTLTKKEQVEPQKKEEIERLFQIGQNFCLNRRYQRCAQYMREVLKRKPDHAEAKKYLTLAESKL